MGLGAVDSMLHIKILNTFSYYFFIVCIIRICVYFIRLIYTVIFDYVLDKIKNLYSKYTQEVIIKGDTFEYSKYKNIFKCLYHVRRLSDYILTKKIRLQLKLKENLFRLLIDSITRVSLINIAILLFSAILVENDNDYSVSYEILRSLVTKWGNSCFVLINKNFESVLPITSLIFGFWIFNLVKEWLSLKKVALDDLAFKQKVYKVYEKIDNNYRHLHQLRYPTSNNIKLKITNNIGYDYEENKLVLSNRYRQKNDKVKSIDILAISDDLHELVDLLKIKNRSICTGNLHTYNSFLALLYDELYSFNSVSSLEYKVLNYDEDYNYQHINEYFSKYNNQIYKREFTKARIVIDKPLEELELMKRMAAEYLDRYSENSKLLIWKYLYIREMYVAEANKYLSNRAVFFKFTRFISRYHFEKVLSLLKLAY